MAGSLLELEKENGKLQVEKIENALQFNLDYQARIARDWGIWTETYEYVKGNNPAFIENNFYEETFQNLDIHYALIYDSQGRLLHGARYDSETDILMNLSSKEITLFENYGFSRQRVTEMGETGFFEVEKQIAAFALQPVLENTPQGLPAGNLVFAVIINESELHRLRNLLQMDLDITPLSDNPDYAKAFLNEKYISRPDVKDRRIQHNYGIMFDPFGYPIAVIHTPYILNASLIAQESIRITGITMIFFIFFSMSIFIFRLDSLVLKRLSRLGEEIRNIDINRLGTRISGNSTQDEISQVTKALNHMLEKLEEANTAIDLSERRSHYLAFHDSLTDLPNKEAFIIKLEKEIQSHQEGRMIMVSFLDLDGFKLINHVMGHDKGDILLQMVADRLRQRMPEAHSCVSRVAGDEFLLYFANLKEESQAERKTEELFTAFTEPFLLEGQEVFITASIGVSLFPFDGQSVSALIKNADIAMYQAKEEGRNKTSFISQSTSLSVQERMELTNGLYRALEKDEFRIFYQLQYDTSEKQVVGMEALLRWQHPEKGLVPPNKFIPIAEQTRLILPIGEWIMHKVCKDGAEINKLLKKKIKVAVNLSVKQFQSNQLVSQISEALQGSGLSPELLEVEITESISMNDYKLTCEILSEIRALGVNISLDDFGTEYSSLAYIKNLPFDQIKIAMPFVHSIGQSEKDESIIKTIIALGKNLGVKLIAEGVETEEQVLFLQNEDCHLIQGYFFAKPGSFEEVLAILEQRGFFHGS